MWWPPPTISGFFHCSSNRSKNVWDIIWGKNGAAAPRSVRAGLVAVPVLQKWGAEFTLPGWGLPKWSLHVMLTSAEYWPDTAACTSVSGPSPTGSSETQRTGIECQLNATFVCIYTCRNTFYMERAENLLLQRLWVFTEGAARSDTGCQPLVHAVIWIRTVATVYFEDFLDCTMHVRLQVCTPPRQWQTRACDWQGEEEKKATETAAAWLQWGCEILSGNNYVNRQHFRTVCW